jgi:hypothetical protein
VPEDTDPKEDTEPQGVQISANGFICVCGNCGLTIREGALLEFNFKEQKIYLVCPDCRRTSDMTVVPPKQPYPRSRAFR